VSAKDKNYNKRMRIKENEVLRKKKINLIIKDFKIREIEDETGEVENTTVIEISFEGILITLSVGAAMKLVRELEKTLNMGSR
jgi:hypothetical protein